MGGADRPLQRAVDRARVRPARGAARRLSRARLLHDRQLRAGADRRRRHQRDPEARHRRARRGAADQELADQDRAQGQEPARAARLRADRHADREPHRRALFHRPISRSGTARPAVPLQPRLLSARRARPPDRLQEPRPIARARASADAAAAQAGRRDGAAGPHRQDILRRDGRGAETSLRGLSRPCGAPHRAGATSPADASRVRASAAIARLHAHGLRHAGNSRSDLPRLPEARGARGHLDRPAGGAGPQGHRLLRMGAHVDDGARARRRDGRRGGLAFRVGAAEPAASGDQPLQARSRLPVVSFDRQRQRRPQSAGRERRDQHRSALEPGEAASSASRARGARTRRVRSRSSISSPRARSSIRSCT